VVKVFANPAFVAEYPDCVDHAVASMQFVRANSDLRVPEVVDADSTGDLAGYPAILMTALGGVPLEVPTRRVFDRIIDVADQVHGLPAAGFKWHHHRYNDPTDTFAPDWFGDSGLFAELAARSAAAVSDEVFIHRDFHPGNLLFDGDLVVGTVDWDYACIGPSGEDFGRTWLNLAADYGQRISTVFASRAARRLDPAWVAATWLDWLGFYEGGETVRRWGTPEERLVFESVGRWAVGLR
jgi:aminoglycoside phosphotransferase (APT) family kinase protein